jgi:teichuronic acid exporter
MTNPGAAKASAWSALDIILRQGVQFVVTVILARLLAPEDFGIIALLTFFTSLSIVFVQGGLSVALIQRQHTSRAEESTIFWWNLIASLVLGVVLIAAGPAIAAFFAHPVLRPLMMMAAAQIIFSALGAVHGALLTRRMRFDLIAKTGLVAAIASGAIGIGAAFLGAGVWALALQVTSSALIGSIGLWFVLDWRPEMHFRFATIRGLSGFGAWVSIGSVMDVLYTNGIALLIGKLHGVRDLGFYDRASATQSLPSSSLSGIIGRIALPLLASKKGDPESLRGSLRLAIGCVMLLNLPIMAGLVLLADLVVKVLLGDRWLAAAPILSILALGGMLFPLHLINVQFVLARGQSRTFMRVEIAKKCIGIACVIVGSFFGIVGLAWSQVVYSVLGLFVNAWPAHRDLGYGAVAQLRDIGGIALATLVMAGGVYFLRGTLSTGPFATLAICSLVGGALYAAVGWIAGFRNFREPAEMLAQEFFGGRFARGGSN